MVGATPHLTSPLAWLPFLLLHSQLYKMDYSLDVKIISILCGKKIVSSFGAKVLLKP